MYEKLFLDKNIEEQLVISREAKSFLDWLIKQGTLPELAISKNGRSCYICNIHICGDFDRHEESVGDGNTKIKAISNAVENIFFVIDKAFNEMYPLAHQHLIKPNWFPLTIAKAPSIVNELVQNKVISNLNYDYFQKGNDKDGNPLWGCKVSAEIYKCYGDNYKVNMIISNTAYNKSIARKFASTFLINDLLDKYNYWN